jgi:hypothetical protein
MNGLGEVVDKTEASMCRRARDPRTRLKSGGCVRDMCGQWGEAVGVAWHQV